MTDEQKKYDLFRKALHSAAEASRAEENIAVAFDDYHRSAQFQLGAIFATLCREAGLDVPIAVGAELYPHDAIFGSNGLPIDGQRKIA